MRLTLILLAVLLTLAAAAGAAVLRTEDGLSLALDERGQVAGLRLGEQALPLTVGGGLWVADAALSRGSGLQAEGASAGTGALPGEQYRQYLRAPLKADKGTYTQEQTFADPGLKLAATYATTGEYLSISGRVEDTTGHDRAVEVTWELPLRAGGWLWADDLLTRREVKADTVYRTVYPCEAGPGYNQIYPFTSLARGEAGLTLGAPLAQGPRIYSVEYDGPDQRLRIRFHLGLSRRVTKLPGRAWFSFLLYRHDGQWGLRAAADRYYRLFPGDFAKRAPYEGYLGYAHLETPDWNRGPADRYDLPDAGDFGRGFNWLWHQHTAYSALRYETTETAHPDDNTVFRLLRDLQFAQGNALPYGWRSAEYELLGQKRRLTAEEPAWSLLGRLYPEASGKITWVGDSRYEAASSLEQAGWLLNFRVTEDPDFSSAVRASLEQALAEWQAAATEAEPYTWCVSADGAGQTGRQLDFAPEHVASSEAPLTYDQRTRKVAVADVSWEWNSKVLGPLSRQHKFLLCRNFICDTPMVGANLPYVDLGMIECEYGKYGMQESSDLYARTAGYRRLMRYWFYPAAGEARDRSIREMFHRGLIYAIYPHLVPNPEPYRDLYLRFVPAIEELSAAGWEPVTLATPSDPDLRVERYGAVARGRLLFACRNVANGPRQARVLLSPDLGLGNSLEGLCARNLLTGEPVAVVREGDRLALPVALGPGEATALSLLPRDKQLQADLRRAAASLRQAVALNAPEEASYALSRPAEFIRDGQPKTARPERVLLDGWVAYQGLVWQPGDTVDVTLDLNSPHRLRSLAVFFGRGEAYGFPETLCEGKDKEGAWRPLTKLSTPAGGPAVARGTVKDETEYQFVRLRFPALTKALWLQEIRLTAEDGAMVRAAERFETLADSQYFGEYGLVSQLALALRVRRMLGHQQTLQEQALDALSLHQSLASGVRAELQLPPALKPEAASEAWLVVRAGARPFKEGSVKLKLPPGWRSAPSKFDVSVPAGQTLRLPLTLWATPGSARLALLVTGMAGEDPIFLNQTLTAEATP